jgi:hypothetical protein
MQKFAYFIVSTQSDETPDMSASYRKCSLTFRSDRSCAFKDPYGEELKSPYEIDLRKEINVTIVKAV